MSRYIDADKLLSSFKNSYFAACKWEEEAKDEEIKARANSAKATFLECYLRTKEIPAADVEEIRHGGYINDQNTQLSLYIAECSCCNETTAMGLYCMWCGAKMDKPEFLSKQLNIKKNGTNKNM